MVIWSRESTFCSPSEADKWCHKRWRPQHREVAYPLSADNISRPPPDPSEGCQSAGNPHLKWVFKTSSNPLGLHLNTRHPPHSTILNRRRFLDRLQLEPR